MDLDVVDDDILAGIDTQEEETQKEPEKIIPLRPSLLTAVSQLIVAFDQKYPKVPDPPNLHPFSPTPPDTDILGTILNVSESITQALAGHVHTTDARFVTRAEEYTTHADAWLQSQMKTNALFRRIETHRQLYAADVPLEPSLIPEWTVTTIMDCLKAGGMEVFRESDSNGKITLVCGGKLLVIDIEFRAPDAEHPQVELVSLKTSRPTAEGSPSISLSSKGLHARPPLDELLFSDLTLILKEAYQPSPAVAQIRQLGNNLKAHIESLMTLDSLAATDSASNTTTGDRWFKEVDAVAGIASELFRRETEVVASSLSKQPPPLDIVLNRVHGYPLPYVVAPAMTFLIYLAPRAYLSLLKAPPAFEATASDTDIPISTIRKYLTNPSSSKHLYSLATLHLNSEADSLSATSHLMSLLPPSFPLLAAPPTDFTSLLSAISDTSLAADPPSHGIPQNHLDHTFPVSTPLSQPAEGASNDPTSTQNPSSFKAGSRGYVLDFGSIMMRREAMNQLAGGMALGMDLESDGNMMGGQYMVFGTPGWTDLLIDPDTKMHYQQYFSSSAPQGTGSPALRHLLTPPTDAGYVLGKIRVSMMSDVWRMIEIVKEQAWLNEALRGFDWKKEAPRRLPSTAPSTSVKEDDDDLFQDNPAEDELAALLQGSHSPTAIPVQVYVRTTCPGPSIHFTVPLPRLGSPLLSFSATYDPTSVKGVRIDFKLDNIDTSNVLQDAMKWKDGMEEVVRRGGISVLAAWVWKKAKL